MKIILLSLLLVTIGLNKLYRMIKEKYISPEIELRTVVFLPVLDDDDTKSVPAEGVDITDGEDDDNSAKQMGTGFGDGSFDAPSWD